MGGNPRKTGRHARFEGERGGSLGCQPTHQRNAHRHTDTQTHRHTDTQARQGRHRHRVQEADLGSMATPYSVEDTSSPGKAKSDAKTGQRQGEKKLHFLIPGFAGI